MSSRQPPRDRRHQPKRSLGQNFLVDRAYQSRIVQAIDPTPDDEVLEIGPGTGALTQHLAGRVRHLHLVELDDDLAADLARRFAELPSVSVVHRDILTVDPASLVEHPESLKVIGNIPYNITTPIIFHLLDQRPRPRVMVLMIQREVADRIVSQPGSKTYGALAVGVQLVADVERVLNVGRGAFRPRPDVDSSVIRITPHAPPRFAPELESAVRSLTRIAFGQRRKQFQRILRDAFSLNADDIARLETDSTFDLTARPETFSPNDFVRLAEHLQNAGHLRPRP